MNDNLDKLHDREALAGFVRLLGEDELRYLNQIVVQRLKLIAQARSTALLSRLAVGERVAFQAPSGERKTGVITRMNRKTASVQTEDGQRWNVHPSLLQGCAGDPRSSD